MLGFFLRAYFNYYCYDYNDFVPILSLSRSFAFYVIIQRPQPHLTSLDHVVLTRAHMHPGRLLFSQQLPEGFANGNFKCQQMRNLCKK